MSSARKSNNKDVPITTAAEVRHHAGDVDDEIVAEILRLQPTLSELETATTHLRGEGDVVDRTGHPLVGKAAQLYEILSSIEALEAEQR